MYDKHYGNKGIVKTEVGYAQGLTKNPSYREVRNIQFFPTDYIRRNKRNIGDAFLLPNLDSFIDLSPSRVSFN
jgi:hypothetical protein